MSNDEQRTKIRSLLESGLETQSEPRADTDEIRRPILDQIRCAHGVEDKIKVAGFTLEPVQRDGTEESCESCMYFAVRRRYCDLPELALPVERNGRAASGVYETYTPRSPFGPGDAMIAIIGCGNSNRRDDGVGPEVIRRLRDRGTNRGDVKLLDAGTDGMATMFAAREPAVCAAHRRA